VLVPFSTASAVAAIGRAYAHPQPASIGWFGAGYHSCHDRVNADLRSRGGLGAHAKRRWTCR